jgi:hypothetical protein
MKRYNLIQFALKTLVALMFACFLIALYMGIVSNGSEVSKFTNMVAISFTAVGFISAVACQQEHKFSNIQ